MSGAVSQAQDIHRGGRLLMAIVVSISGSQAIAEYSAGMHADDI